jgi:hypothetical protein
MEGGESISGNFPPFTEPAVVNVIASPRQQIYTGNYRRKYSGNKPN